MDIERREREDRHRESRERQNTTYRERKTFGNYSREDKANYKNKHECQDHVKYYRFHSGSRWWRHHCRLRHDNPDSCSICSNASVDSLDRSESTKSLITKRKQLREKREEVCSECGQENDSMEEERPSRRRSRAGLEERRSIRRRSRRPSRDNVLFHNPKRTSSEGSCRQVFHRSFAQYFGINSSCPESCNIDLWYQIHDLTYYLSKLYSLSCVLTQFLLIHDFSKPCAFAPISITSFPLIVYLIDNVKNNCMLDILIISNGVFLSTYSAQFNNIYGFTAAFVFCTTHFVLRARRFEDFTKEIFYNLGISVFCVLCLYTLDIAVPRKSFVEQLSEETENCLPSDEENFLFWTTKQ